jgi:hypothetical protein
LKNPLIPPTTPDHEQGGIVIVRGSIPSDREHNLIQVKIVLHRADIAKHLAAKRENIASLGTAGDLCCVR